ncbi:c-type cytochrome [Geovibrio thiophilus]|uniref:C-type cytochrome n=1 Tax=Geovibrio thiophilus TaxID=139438 RepID=A0A3R5Z0F0_9BACT|nr:selenite/tellurite reduction operon c-type cytochrome lipoprotein ExtS [Geovibrio thiophilus]QAR33977.1 c-type cytochrome [Geovibrio thiophilus]
MVARALLLLIFITLPFFPSFASMCVKCHKPHYEKTGSCAVCHRGNEDTARKNIAHGGLITKKYADFIINGKAVENGSKTADSAHCRRCHITEGRGNDVAPNLDTESRRKTAETLKEKLIKPTDYMPDFHMNDPTAENTVKYILNAGGSAKSVSRTAPYVVFITQGKKSVFEEKCGGCHRLLTRKRGGTGHGDTAPNLSGLFSGFYPADTVKAEGNRWNGEILVKWIKNPRRIKKEALMPPVLLTEEEEKSITAEFAN